MKKILNLFILLFSLSINGVAIDYTCLQGLSNRIDGNRVKCIVLSSENGCLTQDMISESNSVYVIQDDYDLQGQTINLSKKQFLANYLILFIGIIFFIMYYLLKIDFFSEFDLIMEYWLEMKQV